MPLFVRFAVTQEDLEAAYALRKAVFEAEQNVPRPLDRDPFDDRAAHAVAFDESGRCIGTGRVVRLDTRLGQIGRQAVLPERRRHGVGAAVLDALEHMARMQGLRELAVHSQIPARHFYEGRGFVAEGEVFLDQGVPHVLMKKSLIDPR
ncbi:MAG TPA: GNAT family N-acetyltransferase [Anaeromyxobacteraceae bacterium]|nr:GNAT family N-acetyltransferase [Anaeromyxobacteraceae bacterium]